MKIVLGFDDSPHAQAALRWVCGQAGPTEILFYTSVAAAIAGQQRKFTTSWQGQRVMAPLTSN